MHLHCTRPRYACALALPVLWLTTLSCIERNNPWDPINGCPESIKAEIRLELQPVIDLSLGSVRQIVAASGVVDTVLDSLQRANAAIRSSNGAIVTRFDSMLTLNASIESFNSQVSGCDSFRVKQGYQNVRRLAVYDSMERLRRLRSELSVESLKIATTINRGNERCMPLGVYGGSFTDSVFRELSQAVDLWDALAASARGFNDSTEAANYREVDSVWRRIDQAQRAADLYNDSITFVTRFCGLDLISSGDSLLRRTAAALAGDTLVIDTGSFTASIRFDNSGTDTMPIVLQGAPGNRTVLDNCDVVLSANSHIQFRNLVFANSRVAGIRLVATSRNIVFENCVFQNNASHGLEVVEGSARLSNCRILGNNGSGIRVSSVGCELVLDNVLIAHNRLYGVDAVTVLGTIAFSTISDNGLDGVRLVVSNRQVTIQNTLLTYNNYYGLRREYDLNEPEMLRLVNVNFFGNTGGPALVDSVYLNSSITYEDPRYHDRDVNSYRIGPDSRLYGVYTIGYRE